MDDPYDAAPPSKRTLPPPSFGALMRITWQHVRAELLEAIHAAGFPEFQDAHFAVFSYPLPDGVRPSELARRKNISRQAVNYLLGQLESLGYVERRAEGDADRRLVHLTPRGWAIADAIHARLTYLQTEWSREVGPDRFAVFLDVLKELSGKAGTDPRRE
ncbi:hypothetical protein GCM10011390_34080 [Aureimonas endophytica]|uniref:HTH marR-type domain-containing protein n=1 Tax=Aureimonas endophytica TaxID=2027858 RepID=A0A916ZSP9_9HYPH|nr:MarR family transcriptional regulator [Aureimonas endophytica]GGE12104.1 hypothetical protein GCM10011390_34080 [Aureimonas endophytica]